jgi:phosphoserine phosphatase RsbX
MSLALSCATRPCTGQSECGDRCGWWATSARIVMAVADGLGHGPEAAYAAEISMACIGAGLDRPFVDIFAACDRRLRDTRGVALAVAVVTIDTEQVTVASVGNIRSVLLKTDKDYRFGASRGIIGGGYARLTPEVRTLASGDVLALFSDGVDEFSSLRETLNETAHLSTDQASAVLTRWARPDDDAAVLVYRHAA